MRKDVNFMQLVSAGVPTLLDQVLLVSEDGDHDQTVVVTRSDGSVVYGTLTVLNHAATIGNLQTIHEALVDSGILEAESVDAVRVEIASVAGGTLYAFEGSKQDYSTGRSTSYSAGDPLKIGSPEPGASSGGDGGGGGAVTVANGADNTQGAKADAPATDSTSAWSVVAVLKGIFGKLLSYIDVGASVPALTTYRLRATAGTLTGGVVYAEFLDINGVGKWKGSLTLTTTPTNFRQLVKLTAGSDVWSNTWVGVILRWSGDTICYSLTNDPAITTITGAATVVGDVTANDKRWAVSDNFPLGRVG